MASLSATDVSKLVLPVLYPCFSSSSQVLLYSIGDDQDNSSCAAMDKLLEPIFTLFLVFQSKQNRCRYTGYTLFALYFLRTSLIYQNNCFSFSNPLLLPHSPSLTSYKPHLADIFHSPSSPRQSFFLQPLLLLNLYPYVFPYPRCSLCNTYRFLPHTVYFFIAHAHSAAGPT